MPTLIHPFERSGLGKAPFRCIGHSHEVYQACQGAPIQPGAMCDHCGAGIMDVFRIVSADNQVFRVGSTCVYKTSHPGTPLYTDVERRERAVTREKRHMREAFRIAELTALLENPEVRETLASLPHPRGFDNHTLLDSVEWMMWNAGNAGKLRTLRLVKEAVNG